MIVDDLQGRMVDGWARRRPFGAPRHGQTDTLMASQWKDVGRYGTIGIELVVAILLLGWGGHWLDARYSGGHDRWLFVGALLGVAVGVRNMMYAIGACTAGHRARRTREPRRQPLDRGRELGAQEDPPDTGLGRCPQLKPPNRHGLDRRIRVSLVAVALMGPRLRRQRRAPLRRREGRACPRP